MDDADEDDPLGAVAQKIGHLDFHHRGAVVLGDEFQVVPGGFAVGLESLDVEGELVEVDFGRSRDRANLEEETGEEQSMVRFDSSPLNTNRWRRETSPSRCGRGGAEGSACGPCP